ncbi:MAG TPA: decaprenyl-phosphate phosphoribosyltransferase [Fimbriimonadales bacterium]|nr:decaprenyl-phosphate phosphoribosyltransferase [Fimbriimonadales bacterium]
MALKDFIKSARPRQWTKNLLVFAGLIFAGKFTDPNAILIATLTFFAFCFTSSAGYIFNDILDKEADKLHPEKRERPIASGRLRVGHAAIFAFSIFILGYVIAWLAHRNAVLSLGLYTFNQLFYSIVARRVAILDVFIIAFGFLIRAAAGAVVLDVTISKWLLLCTLLLALFLGYAKRRHELEFAMESRSSLGGYTLPLLDQLIAISAAASVISYCLYAISSQTAFSHPLLVLTIPFPIFGVFRYMAIIYYDKLSGNPDVALLKDPWLIGTVLLFLIVSLYAMSQEGWGFLSPWTT